MTITLSVALLLCLINLALVFLVVSLYKQAKSSIKEQSLQKEKFYSSIELILDQRQLALYNSIEARLAATKSHVMDTKRLVGDLPSIIKAEIRGELGQLRLAQADLRENIDLLRKRNSQKACEN